MPEYLSKEEVKQWRSSLEKITLEEYAARLGKVIEEEKQTNDLVDIVLKGQPVMSRIDDIAKGEKINAIAQRTFAREKEISNAPFSVSVNDKKNGNSKQETKKSERETANGKRNEAKNLSLRGTSEASNEAIQKGSLRDEVRLTLNKTLTDREQMVFDYFLNNKNKIVYAKDLATLLELPRDYVYKYIKNLRTKIDGDKLQNADNGGYVLSV